MDLGRPGALPARLAGVVGQQVQPRARALGARIGDGDRAGLVGLDGRREVGCGRRGRSVERVHPRRHRAARQRAPVHDQRPCVTRQVEQSFEQAEVLRGVTRGGVRRSEPDQRRPLHAAVHGEQRLRCARQRHRLAEEVAGREHPLRPEPGVARDRQPEPRGRATALRARDEQGDLAAGRCQAGQQRLQPRVRPRVVERRRPFDRMPGHRRQRLHVHRRDRQQIPAGQRPEAQELGRGHEVTRLAAVDEPRGVDGQRVGGGPGRDHSSLRIHG